MTDPVYYENRITGEIVEGAHGDEHDNRTRYRKVSAPPVGCPTCGRLTEVPAAAPAPSPADGDTQNDAPSA